MEPAGTGKEGTFWQGGYKMVSNDSSPVAPYETEKAGISVASMVESIVGCKWSVRLLQLCADGHRRPSMFLRACPGLSAKVMNERLRKMIRFGILQRTVLGEKPPVEVEYHLTPFGLRFMRIIAEVRRLQEAVDQGQVLHAAHGDTEEKR
jgi:DNA-binding HxlR family transcriptional regulator